MEFVDLTKSDDEKSFHSDFSSTPTSDSVVLIRDCKRKREEAEEEIESISSSDSDNTAGNVLCLEKRK